MTHDVDVLLAVLGVERVRISREGKGGHVSIGPSTPTARLGEARAWVAGNYVQLGGKIRVGQPLSPRILEA